MMNVVPFCSLYGLYKAGTDKSMTIRAILLGAISEGVTVINDALISADTLAAVECARALGARAAVESNKKIVVAGTKNIKNGGVFDCKNSATTARLLIGLLAGANVEATVTGDGNLQKRPMSRVVLPLLKRGANIQASAGALPVYIHPATLSDYEYDLIIPSAQVKGALILSGVTANVKTIINEKFITRAHTENMLPYFSGQVQKEGNKITVLPSNLKAAEITVPTDPSSAAFYVAAGLIKGEVTVKNVMLGTGRRGFYDKLLSAGANLTFLNKKNVCGEPCADVTAKKSDLAQMTVTEQELPSMIDEIPVLALIAAHFNGLTVKNAGELKIKESDRLQKAAELINLAGGAAKAVGDDLFVSGGIAPEYFNYQSDDHRMEMTAFIAMATGAGGRLDGENAAEISLPEFYSEFYESRSCLIGSDVSRSLSGDIHKFIATECGDKNYGYECVSLTGENTGEKVEEFIKKSPYRLINVTIPYKETAGKYCELTKKASLSSSVNCIIEKTGYTFDGDGLIYTMHEECVDVKGKKVLVYGAGGAGRSIAVALNAAGAVVYMKNRGSKRLNDFLKNSGKALGIKKYIAGKCDVIINASALKNKCPIAKGLIKAANCVIDINYGEKTEFLKVSEGLGVKNFDGISMLFYQAYLSEACARGISADEQKARLLYKKWREK